MTVTIHMASSLDGFIAKKDGSVSWLETSDHYDKGVIGENPEDFLKTIDCFVIGARTYELALTLGWPYGDTPTTVVTHRNLPAGRDTITFYSGDLTTLFNNQLKPRYNNIWVGGGSLLVKDILRLNLADDIRLSILPVMLGDGIPFFDHVGQENPLHLKEVTAYQNGIVELWYEIRKDK